MNSLTWGGGWGWGGTHLLVMSELRTTREAHQTGRHPSAKAIHFQGLHQFMSKRNVTSSANPPPPSRHHHHHRHLSVSKRSQTHRSAPPSKHAFGTRAARCHAKGSSYSPRFSLSLSALTTSKRKKGANFSVRDEERPTFGQSEL